jgi:predicted HAD superfamily Cof-like phosphohydrolase
MSYDYNYDESFQENNANFTNQNQNQYKTNFEKVIDFCKCAGQPVYTKHQLNIFEEHPERVDLRLKLIQEEVGELEQAIKDRNFTEVIDALSDILYVVYGASATFGISINKTFDIVHESNMTKFCKTEEEAKETVEWYKLNEKRYKEPSYRKSEDGDYWIVFNAENGKILKSCKYKPVMFNV